MTSVLVPSSVASLAPFVDAGVLGPSDVHLAAWIAGAAPDHDPLVALGASMAAWSARHGHSCSVLGELAAVVARQLADRSLEHNADPSEAIALDWPETDVWLDALRAASHVVRVVDTWDPAPVLDEHPLVLCGERLFLQRHWVDECAVAASIRQRAAPTRAVISRDAAALLERLLPRVTAGERDLQRAGADAVIANHLAVVVGGPGTGKTYSVARLLAVLFTDALAHDRPLRVALAAPTGKAAARLQESIATALAQPDLVLALDTRVRASLEALVPTTIHRLLGPLGHRQRFRHDAANALPYDIVVIDETSMVSLPLFARLLDAVSPDARLVLLGDPDQLESVELGAVLGDIVNASESTRGPLGSATVRLLRGRRFDDDTPIALLADAVRIGDADAAIRLMRAGPATALRFLETDDSRDAGTLAQVEVVVGPLLRTVRVAAEDGDVETALDVAATSRILCAHRLGPAGVAGWNRLGERWMFGPDGPGAAFAPGRPLLITRNDQRLGLANGDTGVIVRVGRSLRAVFRSGGRLVSFDPVQLEGVETAFAITVHKSQGSEYPVVVLVLPPATSPLVGRELVYTGITRAKRELIVVGGEASVRVCLATPARRMSGLTTALS
ncbi:MAG: exodeoxyribonuclease V subunit alpha [Ilumatobacteraceae bacterium]